MNWMGKIFNRYCNFPSHKNNPSSNACNFFSKFFERCLIFIFFFSTDMHFSTFYDESTRAFQVLFFCLHLIWTLNEHTVLLQIAFDLRLIVFWILAFWICKLERVSSCTFPSFRRLIHIILYAVFICPLKPPSEAVYSLMLMDKPTTASRYFTGFISGTGISIIRLSQFSCGTKYEANKTNYYLGLGIGIWSHRERYLISFSFSHIYCCCLLIPSPRIYLKQMLMRVARHFQ